MKEACAVLQAKDIRVIRGGRETVNVPSFSLFSHETVALIGPNGSGKSSFLLSLASLLQPEAGQLYFKGELLNSTGLTAYRRRLAMVFQEPLLFNTTVYKNVATGLVFRGVARRDIDRQVEACLERFRITHLAGRSARKLSGGEAQRTSLARAFATNPELLLLDEPFAALDPPTRRALTDDLAQALRDSGTAAIMATHDQPDALYFADRMVVMQEGRIVQTGTATSVMYQPVNEFVATFIGMENILSGSIVKAEHGLLTLAIGNEMIHLTGDGKPGAQITVCIRPEHVMLSRCKPDSGISGCTALPGNIIRVLPFGLYSKVYLDCGFVLVAAVTDKTMSELDLKPSDRVYVRFKETATHFFPQA
jgi:tungstate transport system ATP-binding protein